MAKDNDKTRHAPDDLVVLDLEDPTPEQLDIIMKADWYEPEGSRGPILVSFKQIDGLTETDPLDAGVDLEDVFLVKIPASLKRWHPQDGWYHA